MALALRDDKAAKGMRLPTINDATRSLDGTLRRLVAHPLLTPKGAWMRVPEPLDEDVVQDVLIKWLTDADAIVRRIVTRNAKTSPAFEDAAPSLEVLQAQLVARPDLWCSVTVDDDCATHVQTVLEVLERILSSYVKAMLVRRAIDLARPESAAVEPVMDVTQVAEQTEVDARLQLAEAEVALKTAAEHVIGNSRKDYRSQRELAWTQLRVLIRGEKTMHELTRETIDADDELRILAGKDEKKARGACEFHDYSKDRPIRSTQWQATSVESTPVGPEATQVVFGGVAIGAGSVYFDDFTLEVSGPDASTWTEVALDNGDFESGSPFDGWEFEGSDNDQDGILDVDDACPNEPEVFNGRADDNGCPG